MFGEGKGMEKFEIEQVEVVANAFFADFLFCFVTVWLGIVCGCSK